MWTCNPYAERFEFLNLPRFRQTSACYRHRGSARMASGRRPRKPKDVRIGLQSRVDAETEATYPCLPSDSVLPSVPPYHRAAGTSCPRAPTALQEWCQQIDRQWEECGGILIGGHFRERLKIANLHRHGIRRHDLGGLPELGGGLELSLRVEGLPCTPLRAVAPPVLLAGPATPQFRGAVLGL